MTDRCRATKRDGTPCTLPSNGSGRLCWAHDPANQERRRRGQSRGGKSKPSRELVELKSGLLTLRDDVLAGRVDKGNAAVAAQIMNVYLRTIEAERKLREIEDLARRLEELETALQLQNEGGRYGLSG